MVHLIRLRLVLTDAEPMLALVEDLEARNLSLSWVRTPKEGPGYNWPAIHFK